MPTKRPLRVLILTYIYTDGDARYGGEGRVVWETTQALARAGVKVYVVTSMKRLKSRPHPNITLYKVPFAKKDFLNFNAGELLKIFFWSIPLILLKRIDVIHHLPTNGPDPFARFKLGSVFAMSADPAWDYENPKFGAELKLDNAQKNKAAGYTKAPYDLSSRVARRFFSLLGVNEIFPKGVDIFFYRAYRLEEELKQIRPKSLRMYVPNGVDTKAFNPSNQPLYPRTGGGVRFLHVGGMSRRKGVHYLLHAFLEVVKKYPESELYLVGRGEQSFIEELKRLAAPYPQVHFADNISNEDLPRVYASADVFCLVPLSGSTPTTLSEAFASGLPVIGTKESGSGEVIEKYDAGVVVEPGESAAPALAMERFITQKEFAAQKAQNALNAAKYFSWEYIAEQLIKGYKEALTKK